MDPHSDSQELGESGLANLVRTLRRRFLVVLIPVLLVPAVAAAYALSKDDEYTATSALLFRSTPGSDFRLSSSEDEEREAATNVSLASLDRVAQRTADELGDGVTSGAVAGSVEVTADGDANLLSVAATNRDAVLARRIANEYADQFVVFRRLADRGTVRQAQRRTSTRIAEVQRQLDVLTAGGTGSSNQLRELRAERSQLLDEAKDLGPLATLSSGNVEVTQRADTPTSPSSAKPSNTILLGVALGLLLGVGLAVLFDLFDRRLRDAKDIEAVFRRPTLGAIPLSAALVRNGRARKGRRGRKPADMGFGEMEAFHMLRANLRYFEVDAPIKSVVITSAAPGEGKSTVAWNLAAASANAGTKTLLIEAELRRPTFVTEFKLDDTVGLSQVLTGKAGPWDVLQRFSAGAARNGSEETPVMDVIVAGSIPPNPTDLLESDRMKDLIHQYEDAYDLVVIDTPPVAVVSDAIPLLKQAGGVIVVTLLGSTRRDAALHLHRQLERLNAEVLGLVVNGIDSQDGYYGSAAGYAEAYRPLAQPTAN